MSGLEHEQEGQVVVPHILIRLVYAQDLLSKDPEIQQLFTYRADRRDSGSRLNPAPLMNVSWCQLHRPSQGLFLRHQTPSPGNFQLSWCLQKVSCV